MFILLFCFCYIIIMFIWYYYLSLVPFPLCQQLINPALRRPTDTGEGVNTGNFYFKQFPNSLWESAVLRSWALRKVVLSSEEWRRIPRAAFYIRDKWLKRRGYRGWVFIETRWLVKMSFYWRQKTGCKCEFFLSFFCWCLLVGGRMGPTNSTPQTHPLSFIHHLPNIVP